MRRLALLAFLALATLARPAFAVERLLVPQIAGWKVVAGHADSGGEFTELVPEKETADEWTRRISVEAFRGVARTVPELLDIVASRSAEICDAASAEPPRLGKLAQYDAGSRFVGCGRYKADGKGTYTMYYAIRGRDALFVVSRSWRGEPFAAGGIPVGQQELGDWIAFMRAIAICDSADPALACPTAAR